MSPRPALRSRATVCRMRWEVTCGEIRSPGQHRSRSSDALTVPPGSARRLSASVDMARQTTDPFGSVTSAPSPSWNAGSVGVNPQGLPEGIGAFKLAIEEPQTPSHFRAASTDQNSLGRTRVIPHRLLTRGAYPLDRATPQPLRGGCVASFPVPNAFRKIDAPRLDLSEHRNGFVSAARASLRALPQETAGTLDLSAQRGDCA